MPQITQSVPIRPMCPNSPHLTSEPKKIEKRGWSHLVAPEKFFPVIVFYMRIFHHEAIANHSVKVGVSQIQ